MSAYPTDQEPGYREPGHSHLQSAECRPEACTGHSQWQTKCGICGAAKRAGEPCPRRDMPGHDAGELERPHSRACGVACLGHGPACAKDCPTCHGRAEPTSQAQADADKVQQRRLSELQAENVALRNRAETAEAALAGVTSALETLFRAVPQRIVLGIDPADGGGFTRGMLTPDAILQIPAEPVYGECAVSDLCDGRVHLLACPKHPNR